MLYETLMRSLNGRLTWTKLAGQRLFSYELSKKTINRKIYLWNFKNWEIKIKCSRLRGKIDRCKWK